MYAFHRKRFVTSHGVTQGRMSTLTVSDSSLTNKAVWKNGPPHLLPVTICYEVQNYKWLIVWTDKKRNWRADTWHQSGRKPKCISVWLSVHRLIARETSSSPVIKTRVFKSLVLLIEAISLWERTESFY